MLRPEFAISSEPQPIIGPAEPPALHVMSFNLRNAGPGQYDPWADRRPVMRRLLGSERPTVIGTQEGLYGQVQDVADDLPAEYDWIGTGRDGGSRGEFMAIYFDSTRLRPLEFDHFWLSDTPDVVGSATWGNEVVRMATWARFHDESTGREFIVVNTHLDHATELAQQRGAELLASRVADLSARCPVIVTGDFNVAAANSSPYRTLVDGGLVDTWLAADNQSTPDVATYHGYLGAIQNGERIDWILVHSGIEVSSAAVNTYHEDDAWASDHWPVQAVLHLP